MNIIDSSYVTPCVCVRMFRGTRRLQREGSSRGHRQQVPHKIRPTLTILHGVTSREELRVGVMWQFFVRSPVSYIDFTTIRLFVGKT